MATKQSASTAASTSQDSAKKAKRQVSVLIYKKWQTNYEQEYQTLSWLRCDVDEHDKSFVGMLWCAVGDSRGEYVESRTSRTSGLPDRATTSVAMS